MNIFKWSWVIPVLFKQITKFLVRIMSLLRYNADQFWFLKIKSLQITLTHGNFPALLHLTWRECVGFPSASATCWCELGARGGVCPPFSDITLGLRGPRSELEALETLVQLSRAQFICRAAESEARYGHVTLGNGFAGRHQPPPLLPSHTCQGGCPQWSWGSDPRVGLHGFASRPASWPSPHREEGGGSSWQGACFSAQCISCLSSGRLCTKASNFQPERDVLR